jgi:hypothetical protein
VSAVERDVSSLASHRPRSAPLPLSVIVSIRNSSATLGAVLVAIRGSDLRRESYEIIVVDDSSSDGSVAIAARYADTVVKLSGKGSGPAYARNRGVELARGEVVAFVGADVVLRRDTLSRMLSILSDRPDVDAVSASRDETAGAQDFVSEYWNLLLRFGEERYPGRSAQFATGCGAVRREAFLSAGMYDEWRFGTACLEDVELGDRLLGSGRSALLSSDLKVTYLKQWDTSLICQEVWGRSKLLARSLGYARMSALAPGDVVFTLGRGLTTASAFLGTLLLAAAFVPPPPVRAEIAMALVVLLLTNMNVHRFYQKARGVGFAAMSAPIHVLVQMVAATALCAGWSLRYLFGDVSPDAATQAYSEVGLEIWPPVPRRPR